MADRAGFPPSSSSGPVLENPGGEEEGGSGKVSASLTTSSGEGEVRGRPSTPGNEKSEEGGRCGGTGAGAEVVECAVCLQTCVYPVQLPCTHVFCYLCVKGVTLQSKRCAMCRREIPADYLHNPDLLHQLGLGTASVFEDGGQWFYEGRNGWWLYDERTSQEIEAAWSSEEQRCELLIAGFLYVIDFEHMLQYRRNDPSRRRRIKRDQASGPKKGVAGLRIEGGGGGGELTTDADTPLREPGGDSNSAVGGGGVDDVGAGEDGEMAEALESLTMHGDDEEREEEEEEEEEERREIREGHLETENRG